MFGLRDDHRGVGGAGDVQCGAAHIHDLADRLADGDEWNRQAGGGEQRGRGDGGGAGHAHGSDRDQEREHHEEQILCGRVVQSLSVDGEHRQQHRPHAGASGHAEIGTQSGHERGDVARNAGAA